MSRILSFCANPYTQEVGVGAIQTSWDLSNSLTTSNVQDMYLYLSKKGISTGQSISTPIVVPKIDSSNNLTTSFIVDSNTEGVQFPIEIGDIYEVIFQVVYKIGANPIQADSSSPAKLVLVSSLPPAPNFTLDYDAEPSDASANRILITLKDASGNEPQPESEFDGYLTLAGAFITYSSGSNLQSVYVSNDVSNGLYNSPIEVVAVAGNEYEVAVALYNYTIDTSCNMNFGGRGPISDAQIVDVENLATAPKNFEVYETMRDEPSDASAAEFTYVSNTLKWQNPTYTGVSFESFVIYRDDVLVETITDLSGAGYTYEWVDASGMTAGTRYTYVIRAVNVDGEGLPATQDMVGVVFPTVNDFTAEPASATSAILTITPSPNGFNSSLYDFSYNGAPSDASNNIDVSYNATGLTTNQVYLFEGRVKSTSNTSGSRIYESLWEDVSAEIYDPVMAVPQNFAITAVDPSGLPLDGELKLSWTNSSSTPISGQMKAVVEQEVGSNWKVIKTLDASASQPNDHLVSNLTNGELYKFRVKNTIDNGSQQAASDYVQASGTPFTYPGPVQNLVLDASGETNKLYYSFDAPDVSGGSAVSDYRFVLNNLNDGSSNLVSDLSGITDLSGELTSVMTVSLYSGTQYQLIVYARNNGGSVEGPSDSDIAFTVPTGYDNPTASNSDASGNFYEYIKLDWDYETNDASNVTYNIYKNAEASPSFTGIVGTTYTDSQTVIGAPYRYQVVPVVNGVEGKYDPSNIPVPSDPARALRAPDQVDEVRVDDFTINSLDVSWNASTNGSGQPDANVIYKIELIDPSGDVADSSNNLPHTTVSYNFTGLTEQYYTVKVYAGVSTVTSPQEHYNNVNPAEVTQYLYNNIPVPIATIQPSNTALLANWTHQTDVSGLTFVRYDTELATDASFLNVVDNTSLNTSEYFYTGLSNGTTYYLHVRNVYKTTNNVEIDGDWSSTVESVPGPAPNQPVGVSAFPQETSGTADVVRVFWDFPISPDEPSKYAVEYSTDASNIYDGTLTWIELADLSNNGSQYYTDITSLQTGLVYYFIVYAGQEVVNVTYVSQPSQRVSSVPYTVPSGVRNLDGTSYPDRLVIDWNTPSNTGGAGVGSNGPILYEATLYNDSSFVPANLVDTKNNISNTTGDIVATFTGLTNNKTYWARVRAFFDVQNTENLSYGPYEDLSLNTSNTPREPGQINIVDEGTLGSTTGKQVEISWLVDASFAVNESKISRTIQDPDGVQLVPKTQIATLTNQTPAGNILSFVDIDGSSNPNPANFLNGNKMIYDVKVTYTYAQGSIVYDATQSNPAIPYGAPIATDQSGNSIDLSNLIVPVDEVDSSFTQIDVHINKNGRNLTSLLALGIPPDGSTEPIPVVDPDVNTIAYSNPQFNGKMAKDQYVKYRFNFGTPVVSTFVSESNAAGSLQSSYPPGSFA